MRPRFWRRRLRQDTQQASIQPEAWQLVLLANQARAAAGAGPLKWDPALAAAARQHCLRMVAEGPIAHHYEGEPDVAGRAAQAGARFSLIEENVAVGPTPAAIHEAWMHSPGHRANLLNPDVDRVGVAVVASRGGLYAVADYERAVPVLTQAQVEARGGPADPASGITVLRDPAWPAPPAPRTKGCLASASGPQPRFIMRWQDAELTRLPQALVNGWPRESIVRRPWAVARRRASKALSRLTAWPCCFTDSLLSGSSPGRGTLT